jgi:hypothetical protein
VIAHVVLFRPKPSLTPEERQALIMSLQGAVDGIPSIARASIGRRILLNRPGYESLMQEDYEYAAILEFASDVDLRAYLDHPAHSELGARLFASAAAVLAYDFDCVGAARLGELLE